MKFIISTTTLLIFSIGLAGCDNTAPSKKSTTTASSDVTNKTTANLTKKDSDEFKSALPDTAPTLKVGTTGTVAPFTFQDNYGSFTGFDIDVIRAIGEVEGFKTQFFKESWQTIFNSVESGKDDLAIGSIKYTPERAQRFALSNPYFYNPAAIMYKNPKLNIKGFNDLKGLKVGAIKNTTHYNKLMETKIASEIVPEKSTFLAFQALINDKVDAVALNYGDSKVTASKYPNYKIFLVPYESRNDPLAQLVIATSKTKPQLQAQINEGLEKIKANGTLDKLQAKWNVAVDDNATVAIAPISASTSTSAPTTNSASAKTANK